jgi:uncharacterized protein YceH (UPF0502 family)
MTLKTLTPIEARFSHADGKNLMPDGYHEPEHALVLGCNQKTSREPLMDISDDDCPQRAANAESQSLVFGSGRQPCAAVRAQLSAAAVVSPGSGAMGLLMLRGATAAELRLNGDRASTPTAMPLSDAPDPSGKRR